MAAPQCEYRIGNHMWCDNPSQEKRADGHWICKQHAQKIRDGGPVQFNKGPRPDKGLVIRRTGQPVRR